MRGRCSLLKAAAALLVGISGFVNAGPILTIDKTEFDAGSIREGEKSFIMYEFKFKNTGDAPLKIEKVNPG